MHNNMLPIPSSLKTDQSYSSWQLFKDIAKFLKPYKGRFLLASLLRLLGDLAWLYPAFAFASIITFLTQYRSGNSLGPVWLYLGFWMVAVLFRTLGQYGGKYLGNLAAEKSAIDLMLRSTRHLFRLDMAWHEKENSGNKIKCIQNAVDGLNRIIRLWFNNIIEICVNLIAINIIIAGFDRTVMACLLLFIITYFTISASLTRRAGQASFRVNAQEEIVSGLMFETINNIRTVKAMSLARSLTAIITTNLNNLFGLIRKRVFRYQSRNSLLSFWANTFKIAIIILIIKGIVGGNYALGFLVLFNSYFSDLRASIDELSEATQDFTTAKFSLARLKKILEQPAPSDEGPDKTTLGPSWKKISFKNVAFSYGPRKVLQDISFEIKRGEKIGIVGLSGAGKSTLFKLLLKEREEFQGDILFDEVPLKNIRRDNYFNQVSVVLQDTEVFNFSLKDNITIANADRRLDQDLLRQSIKIAHISNFAKKLPQGLDTIIGEKGIKLSGGERQRLGIARAIFKEPELLLLDEATSHLDLESEEKIRDSLHKFFENVTAIVIAHRLTTIREMDRILLIEKGKIIESGNFAELYDKHGRFYELWEKQKL